jgi:hypothetical protein
MSNTVRQPRKRPRVKSCNFTTLGWLIRREAAFVIEVRYSSADAPSWRRRWWATLSTQAVERRARAMLALDPPRRYYP